MSPPKREHVPDLLGVLAVAGFTAAGFVIGGPIGVGVMAPLGLSLSGQIIQGNCSKFKEQLLSSKDGALNHDIQKALARSFENALGNIEKKYLTQVAPLQALDGEG